MRVDKQLVTDTLSDIKNTRIAQKITEIYQRLGKLRPLVFVALFVIMAGVVMLFFTHAETQISVACPTNPGATIIGPYGADRPGHLHAGIDIGVEYKPIYAAENGQITFSGANDQEYYGYQQTIDLRGTSGRVYRYAHLSRRDVSAGQGVGAGQVIGQSGDGDGTLDPHLHWEIRTDGGGFGFNGTVDPTWAYQHCGTTGGSGGSSQPSAPSVATTCSNSASLFTVSWQEAGKGSSGYNVNLYLDSGGSPNQAVGSFYNKYIPAGTITTSGPSGFNRYDGTPSAGPAFGNALNQGQKYYINIYYPATNEQSVMAGFVAQPCNTPQSTSSQPPAPTLSPTCNNSNSMVNISWQEAGRGSRGYIANLYRDSGGSPNTAVGSFYNKFISSGTTTTTAPNGFSRYDGTATPGPAFGNALSSGQKYYVNIYYPATNEQSVMSNFTAQTCNVVLAPTPDAGSTTITISGRVMDANGNGVSGAAVYICANNETLRTDSNGYWSKAVVPGVAFCARTPNTSGVLSCNFDSYRATNNRAGVPNNGCGNTYTYEYQMAGRSCGQGTTCGGNEDINDRNSDSGYDFRAASPPNTSTGSTTTSGNRQIIGVGSNRCVDVVNFARTPGSPTQIWDCTGGANQQWTFPSDNTIRVYGSLCLGLDGNRTAAVTAVVIQACSGAATQQWVRGGDQAIRNTGANNQCLDVYGGGTSNGSRLIIYPCHLGPNQRWRW